MNDISILIVEDEGIVAENLSGKLKRLGYSVVGIAAEGEAAVELALRFRPQLVLMDIHLEGLIDGIQAAEAIRARYDVPVIYLTAHSDPGTLARAKLTGPVGFILKPFEMRDLATQIELALYKHRADQKLHEQREWLRVTLNSIGDAVLATDASGTITFLNPVAESLTGWNAGEAIGRPVQEVFRVFNEITRESVEQPVREVLDKGKIIGLANHALLLRKQGGEVPIEDSCAPIRDAQGQVRGAVLVFHDISKQRLVQRALQASETKYRNIFETSRSMMIIFAVTDGRVIDANGTFCQGLGFARDEIVGRTMPQIRLLGDLEHQKDLASRLETTGRLDNEEVRITTRTGQTKVALMSAIPMDIAEEHCIVASFIDITERKQMEEQLRTLNQELEQRVENRTRELQESQRQILHAEKLSAIGKLSASIAHEFNNPLQGVMTILKDLKENFIIQNKDRMFLELAYSETERMKTLIRNLQDFNRPSSGKKVFMDIHASITSLLLLCQNDFRRKGISTAINFAKSLPQVLAVPDQIKQVILNLLQNAADACQDSCTIEISTFQENDQVFVAIRDNGIGIPPDRIDLIFQPFYTTKPEVKGTGLGLSISHGIIQDHRGRILVESKPGEGSTFTIQLPVHGGPAAAHEVPPMI